MRTIKFRAQRSDNKKWCYFTLGDFVSRSQDLSTIDKGFDWLNWCEFIGSLDKNKNEIYEGDILECRHESLRAEVIFWNLAFRMKWRKDSPRLKHLKWPERENGELVWGNSEISLNIIGNIYDNPELIK